MSNPPVSSLGRRLCVNGVPGAVAVQDHPLRGYTVGVTADRRWEEQAELLQRRGAEVIHGASIRTLPLGADAALRDATQRLIENPPDFLIANTGIGMRAWFAAAEAWGIGEALLGALRCAELYSRGPKASGVVVSAGLEVHHRAPTERLDELLAALLREPLQAKTVAFQLHGEDSPHVSAQLESAGASVVEVPVYEWTMPVDERPALRLIEAAVNRRLHAITFTSAPAVDNLMRIARGHGLESALRDALNDTVIPMCVGHVCGEAASSAGVVTPLVPDRARLGPMIRTLTDRLIDSGTVLDVAGVRCELNGSSVLVDGVRVDLSEKEAQLLRVLIRRPGAVVSRARLLSEVWTADTDPHVLEVTIGRLRRRVGSMGTAIVSVPRRGYVLRVDA